MPPTTYEHLLWLIPIIPLIGALINGIFGHRLREPAAGWLATAASVASFGLAVASVAALMRIEPAARGVGIIDNLGPWMHIGRFQIDFSLTLDPLSAVMILVVTGVGSLIHLYSIGYMHGDPRYGRFFAFLNLFLGSMLVLVLGSNYLLLYVGWELVGMCSYLLIGFWFERPSAAAAGKKAFLVNRVGDFGFALGIMLLFTAMAERLPAGQPIDLTFRQAFEVVGMGILPVATIVGVCLLLFWGATGKSAQIPLYVWLPDAMEGPTPVSALIHAATMVTAGVYMVARNHVLFSTASPEILGFPVVAVIGALTALLAASIALAQTDIKRVLAYSTVSQLGYMFLGVGVGAYAAGIFHLVTHAFFKACLFLGAGSVMHGLHDEVDMRRMGGLKRYLPHTRATFLIATIAIAGLPPLSGFFSKDAILAGAFLYHGTGPILFAIGLITAVMTSFYMFRLYYRVFEGEPETPYGSEATDAGHSMDNAGSLPSHEDADGAGHSHSPEGLPHESPPIMTSVLWILAILAAFGGLIGFPEFMHLLPNAFGTWLAPVFEAGEAEGHHASAALEWALTGAAVLAAIIGWGIARSLYGNPRDVRFEKAQPLERSTLLRNKWYVDEAYQASVVRPGHRLATFSDAFDRHVVNNLVMLVSYLVFGFGEVFRNTFQGGYIRWYVWSLLGGATALLAWFIFFSH